MLEWISGQRDTALAIRLIETVPVDLVAVDVELAHGGQDLVGVAPALVAE
jgi:hypothetical protein